MRCEPWMNYTPPAPKSPLEIARDNLRAWEGRYQQALEEVAMCAEQCAEASAYVAKLKTKTE